MPMPARHRRWLLGLLAAASIGCGGEPAGDGSPSTESGGPNATTRSGRVHFVGFDCSPPLVDALKQGKLEGTVVQNPFKMAEISVKTLVAHLEKKPVEASISTGETMVTPANMAEPEVAALLNAPKVENSQDAAISGPKSKSWRIMVIPKGTSHEHWKTIHAGALKASEELGNVELIWQGPQKEDDRNQQIQLVQNAIAAGVDGLVLAPLDARALVGPVEQAIDRGIPVLIFDSMLESKKIVSYVATDNYNGGVLAARRLGELMGGEGKVLLVRYMVGSASTEQREQGFLDTIAKEFPRITYLDKDQYAGATAESAQRTSQNLVTRYRDVVEGIFTPNESSTVGMLRALQGTGLLDGGAGR